jgi:hypothetical protein
VYKVGAVRKEKESVSPLRLFRRRPELFAGLTTPTVTWVERMLLPDVMASYWWRRWADHVFLRLVDLWYRWRVIYHGWWTVPNVHYDAEGRPIAVPKIRSLDAPPVRLNI